MTATADDGRGPAVVTAAEVQPAEARHDTVDDEMALVVALTRAARRRNRRTSADGTVHDDGPVDFPDLLARALAAVAANLGSVAALTAGRPGSWEVVLVEQLVTGTVGDDDRLLWSHRTEPVLVGLNVLELADDTPGFPHVDDALDQVDAGHDLTSEDPAQIQAWESDVDATKARYAALYRGYADAFTAAVADAVRQIPGLAVPVHVQVAHDPGPAAADTDAVHNPSPDSCQDQLALRLWWHARESVPFPTLQAEVS